ncbi:MAG: rhomboid family intramembrane serine protease [Verrucomicrobiales bacterium]
MSSDSETLPIWARPEAFDQASEGWGWVDRKGRPHECRDFDDLYTSIVSDAGARVDLVWTPANDFVVLPEEVPELLPALKEARVRWAEWDISEGQRQMVVFGMFIAVFVGYSYFTKRELIAFGPLGLALLLFLILGFLPWYQGKKRLRRAHKAIAEDLKPVDLEGLRFEVWLQHQKAPWTRLLVGLIGAVALVQVVGPGSMAQDLQAAALWKVDGRPVDWWRLATAPFMHGHWVHFLMNAMALVYLGRRVELLARWPHMVAVFVFAAWAGGEATARYGPQGAFSLGASGGIIGLLGFLMVFESMHSTLVPESVRRRLLAGLFMTAALGMVGYKVIDNWAHGGGLVAGMIYAFFVFPKSASPHRPVMSSTDAWVGRVAMLTCILAAVWTVWCLFLAS